MRRRFRIVQVPENPEKFDSSKKPLKVFRDRPNYVGMSSTGNPRFHKSATKMRDVVAVSGRSDIAREMRIEGLRQMVAAGRYKVEPQKLALRILVRALRR